MEVVRFDTTALREPGEQKLLRRTAFVLAVGYVCAIGLTLTIFFLWFIVACLTVAVLRARYQAEAIEVGPRQFAKLNELVARCCARVGEPPLRAYVSIDPGNWPVFTIPVPEPAVLIHANFLKMLTDDEMEFFIYHELGHAKMGHRAFLNPVNVLENVGPISWVLTTPLEIIRYALRPWLRKADFSADRYALACLGGRLEVAAAALAKVTAGDEMFEQVDAISFLEQSRRIEDSRLLACYEIASGRIGNARRLSRLARFAASTAFPAVIEPLALPEKRGMLGWFRRRPDDAAPESS